MKNPTLYIFSGLPATGKSTLAELLARRVGAAYVRIDTIEQALRDLCSVDVQGEGYRLAYRLAADNLRLAGRVILDTSGRSAQECVDELLATIESEA